ncbi:acyl carrier protein [Methylocystis sp. WRRC1]|uniref:acyl carrier protein n=1 Tax=unclassified Methylocystis TaxID=2625913 RepID=UPI0001F86F8E|nr:MULTISPECIES: acyl carrier protein [unclassified Methylocystis]MCC3245013.1 acyl carrier protein [Methylocystis sp. WRRC1]
MSNPDMLEEIRTVIVDVLDLENAGEITEATTADEVEGWDSLQHVRILTALERKFQFRFSDEEIEGLKNVGDLVAAVARRAQAAG